MFENIFRLHKFQQKHIDVQIYYSLTDCCEVRPILTLVSPVDQLSRRSANSAVCLISQAAQTHNRS